MSLSTVFRLCERRSGEHSQSPLYRNARSRSISLLSSFFSLRMGFPDLIDLIERISFSKTALAEERENGGGARLSWFDLPTGQASYSYRLNI